jgi:hypothetical protein
MKEKSVNIGTGWGSGCCIVHLGGWTAPPSWRPYVYHEAAEDTSNKTAMKRGREDSGSDLAKPEWGEDRGKGWEAMGKIARKATYNALNKDRRGQGGTGWGSDLAKPGWGLEPGQAGEGNFFPQYAQLTPLPPSS